MSLTEVKVTDKIEVLENGIVQVREANRILRDGVAVAQNFTRYMVMPGQATQDMDPKVIAICAAVHTPEVIAAYEAEQAARAAEMAARAEAAQQE